MARLTFADLEARAHHRSAARRTSPTIKVGMSTCGMAAGAEPVFAALRPTSSADRSTGGSLAPAAPGCAAWSRSSRSRLPGQPAVMFGDVTPEFARRSRGGLRGRQATARRRTACPAIADLARIAGEPVAAEGGPRQYRIVMRNCGVIDPEEIDEYLDRGGYQALGQGPSTMTPEQVIEELKISGLRGRGGAGFPAWLKWSLTRESAGDEHLIVCNGDEGDPGAYMDRSVLEGDPARRSRRHDHRRLRDRRQDGLLLHPRRVPAGDPAHREGHPPGARRRPSRATTSSAPTSASTSRSGSAPAPSCAAKRRP